MVQYRIYTEFKPDTITAIEKLVAAQFDGFNVFVGKGYWKGTPESALVIEVLAGDEDSRRVSVLAYEIKALNAQESVLVTATQVQAQFV